MNIDKKIEEFASQENKVSNKEIPKKEDYEKLKKEAEKLVKVLKKNNKKQNKQLITMFKQKILKLEKIIALRR